MAERVAVIGAGQMGNGIAHVFAQNGFDVAMIDVSADAVKLRVQREVEKLPRVSAAPEQMYVSGRFNRLMDQADATNEGADRPIALERLNCTSQRGI